MFYDRGLQTFLSEDHISYNATVGGPVIIRNVFVSGYVVHSTKSPYVRNNIVLPLLIKMSSQG